MTAIALTPDGDIDLSSGGLRMVDDVAQRLRCRLRLFRGEWFLRPGDGVPYFQTIVTARPNLAHIRAAFRKVIVETPGVVRLSKLVIRFDRANRILVVRAEINNRVSVREELRV